MKRSEVRDHPAARWGSQSGERSEGELQGKAVREQRSGVGRRPGEK